jgi:hypothetical protein
MRRMGTGRFASSTVKTDTFTFIFFFVKGLISVCRCKSTGSLPAGKIKGAEVVKTDAESVIRENEWHSLSVICFIYLWLFPENSGQ